MDNDIENNVSSPSTIVKKRKRSQNYQKSTEDELKRAYDTYIKEGKCSIFTCSGPQTEENHLYFYAIDTDPSTLKRPTTFRLFKYTHTTDEYIQYLKDHFELRHRKCPKPKNSLIPNISNYNNLTQEEKKIQVVLDNISHYVCAHCHKKTTDENGTILPDINVFPIKGSYSPTYITKYASFLYQIRKKLEELYPVGFDYNKILNSKEKIDLLDIKYELKFYLQKPLNCNLPVDNIITTFWLKLHGAGKKWSDVEYDTYMRSAEKYEDLCKDCYILCNKCEIELETRKEYSTEEKEKYLLLQREARNLLVKYPILNS